MFFRIARHTDNLENIIEFYIEIFGLEKLGEFNNHDGYDGVFLGKNNHSWHLEFTKSNKTAQHTFDEDDILVFYPSTNEEFKKIETAIKSQHIAEYIPQNPYWTENGIMIKDPDGYNIIISAQKIH